VTGGGSGGCVTPLDLTTVAAVVAVFTVVYRRQSVGARKLGPDLQNILRFIVRLSYVYRTIDLR